MKIAVTGHRKLDHSLDKVIESVCKTIAVIQPSLVITGMAVGFDQAVALACIQSGTPFEAAVPFKGQESIWPEDAQQVYREILEQAQKVTVVSIGTYAAWKMHARNGYMIKNADIIIGYCRPTETKGGTFEAMKLASSYPEKKIINIYPMITK